MLYTFKVSLYILPNLYFHVQIALTYNASCLRSAVVDFIEENFWKIVPHLESMDELPLKIMKEAAEPNDAHRISSGGDSEALTICNQGQVEITFPKCYACNFHRYESVDEDSLVEDSGFVLNVKVNGRKETETATFKVTIGKCLGECL